MSKSNNKAKLIISIASLPVIAAVGVALAIGNDIAFNVYANTLTTYLCPAPEDTAARTQNLSGMGDELAIECEREGIVMLHNNGTLPLDKSDVSQVNVFGHGSIDWYIMSSGSERVGTNGHVSYDFNSALEKRGISVNPELPTYYKKWHQAEGDSNTIMANFDSFFQIREPSLETQTEYQQIYERAKDYSDTAFFVISRHAGENSDCPHYQNKCEGQPKDETRTYLEISTEEEYTLRQLAKDFENVVVVVNSTNNMTLDFVDIINKDTPDGIDAVLNVGVTGGQGALAIPDVIFGTTNPSGRMTDTTPYRPEYNITYFRSCAKHTRHYTGGSSSDYFSKAGRGAGGGAFYNYACYVEYTEGIYMGYRWFETADAEGFWDTEEYGGYENVVQYPFGFGLSYSTFKWEFNEASKADGSTISEDETITIKIDVTNEGEYKGKDVVEIYLTAPYYEGGIEKSSRKLVGYEKTPELKPGETATLEIEVDTKDFKSYDDYDANKNKHTGYELEHGDYELYFMTDAHNVKDMYKDHLTYSVDEDIMIDEDEVTGATVENRFTGENAYEGMPTDGSSVDQNIEFVHRNNFPPLLTECEPDKPWTDKLKNRANGIVVDNYSYNKAMSDNWDNATEDYFGNPIPQESLTWGSGGNGRLIENGKLTDLGMQLGADYDDPGWESLLDQVPFDTAKHIVSMNSQYKASGITEIGLRETKDNAYSHAEGAAMIGGGLGQNDNVNCPAYPGPTMVCQAWNRSLTYKLGKSMGNDMNSAGKDAIYSPNCNLHRSTYGGRNCGYQSEDPILSGRYVSEIIKGISVYGHTTFVKHFALNDQDFNRMALMTWTTEQAMRELYLRSFEEAVKNGGTVGIMTSFNRIGGIWAGGNEALIQGVLRNEWGFRGQIITDMTENATNMDWGFHFRFGGNIILQSATGSQANAIGNASNTPIRVQLRMRDAIHEIAYSYTHSLYRNATYNASVDHPSEIVVSLEAKRAYLWWQPAIITLDAFVYGGLIIAVAACALNIQGFFRKPKKEEEDTNE
ncbi:MAG: glycoside hydrolase family 3 C-terminal domain-containing protein [Bacilli bacterium]|nr:glycoside hydrolase family 3 C-terminal domain-containing protein [Bacilli bacterium]